MGDKSDSYEGISLLLKKSMVLVCSVSVINYVENSIQHFLPVLTPYIHGNIGLSMNSVLISFSAITAMSFVHEQSRGCISFILSQTLKHLYSSTQAQESTVMLHAFVLILFPELFNITIDELQIDSIAE
jgi:hypothetical protein